MYNYRLIQKHAKMTADQKDKMVVYGVVILYIVSMIFGVQ